MKVGIIGMGVMGENHLRVYKNLGVDVTCVCDIKYKGKKPNNITGYYTDYKKMIKFNNLDIISVTVPTKLHKKIAIDCIKAGINVIIEKPMACNTKECDKIIKIAEKKGVKVMIGHLERFNPAVIELKRNLSKIGKIYKVSAKRVGPFHPRIRDTGVVLDLAIHDIDILTYLIGEIKESYSVTNNIGLRSEDLFNSVLIFENNAVGNIETDWISPEKERTLEITGEFGKFKLDYLNKTLVYFNEADFKYFEIKKTEPLKLELTSFIKSVEADLKPEITGEEGRKAVYLVEKFIG